MARFEQPWTTYYFILAEDEKVGAIRVVDKKDGSRKRISPIWIMLEHRNKGYAQEAVKEVERIHGSDHWCLDTILQEKGNLHLYEKLGYHRTGRIDKINDRMDIVFYEKDGKYDLENGIRLVYEVMEKKLRVYFPWHYVPGKYHIYVFCIRIQAYVLFWVSKGKYSLGGVQGQKSQKHTSFGKRQIPVHHDTL